MNELEKLLDDLQRMDELDRLLDVLGRMDGLEGVLDDIEDYTPEDVLEDLNNGPLSRDNTGL